MSWRVKPWRKLCTKFLGPLLPDSAERAALWLGRRNKLRIGFDTVLERRVEGNNLKAIYVRQAGKLLKGWSDPGGHRASSSVPSVA